jgi:hypothetical protein
MNEVQEAMIEAVRVPDAAWFDLDDDRLLALQLAMSRRIREAQAEQHAADDPDAELTRPPPEISLACAAPQHADLRQHTTLPLLIMVHSNGMREWLVNSETNMLVTACDLETGAVWFIRPMDSDKRMEDRGLSSDSPMPDPFDAATTGSGIEQIDLLSFGFARATAQVALSVIDFDVCSNVVTVAITGHNRSVRAAPVVEVMPFLQPQVFEGPADRTSCVLRLSGENTDAAGHLLLRGNVRVTPPRYAPQSRDGHGLLLPVTLLFVQRDRRAVESVNLRVPVQPGAGMVEGGFSLDLRDTGMLGFGRTQLYLVAGSELAGPYPVMREE